MGLFNSSLDLTLFVPVTEESHISRHSIFYIDFIVAFSGFQENFRRGLSADCCVGLVCYTDTTYVRSEEAGVIFHFVSTVGGEKFLGAMYRWKIQSSTSFVLSTLSIRCDSCKLEGGRH